MIKSSFTVGYRLKKGDTSENHVVLGVTSIVPNLNGFLMFTEDGQNHFIEQWQLLHNTLTGIYMSYDIEDELDPLGIVHDHRSK
jgi:hypothetical protein